MNKPILNLNVFDVSTLWSCDGDKENANKMPVKIWKFYCPLTGKYESEPKDVDFYATNNHERWLFNMLYYVYINHFDLWYEEFRNYEYLTPSSETDTGVAFNFSDFGIKQSVIRFIITKCWDYIVKFNFDCNMFFKHCDYCDLTRACVIDHWYELYFKQDLCL